MKLFILSWTSCCKGLDSQTDAFATTNIPWLLETLYILCYLIFRTVSPLTWILITLFYSWEKGPYSQLINPYTGLGPSIFYSKTHCLPVDHCISTADQSHLPFFCLGSLTWQVLTTQRLSHLVLCHCISVGKGDLIRQCLNSHGTCTISAPITSRHHPMYWDSNTLWAKHADFLLLPKNNVSPSVT